MEKKSNFSLLVNNLIYPGILGSMIYDFLRFELTTAFAIKTSILIFFILDYCHLNFILERRYQYEQKNDFVYIFGDLLASILLVIAFKYSHSEIWVSTFCLAAVPVAFHQYSEKLKYNRIFYRYFAFTSIIILFYSIYKSNSFNQTGLLAFTVVLTTIYLMYNNVLFRDPEYKLPFTQKKLLLNKKTREVDLFGSIIGVAIAILILSGFVVLIYFLIGLKNKFNVFGEGSLLLEESAQVGDFVGGLVGSLWAFAGVVLFYLALRLQRKEFKSQREELRQQKNEFQINRITNIIYKQLEILQNKKNQLKISVPKSKEVLLGQDVIDKLPFRYSLKFNNKTDFDNLSKDQIELLALWEIAGSDVKIKEYVNSLLKYIKLLTGLINQAKSQKDSITDGDTKQLISIAYENIQSQRELIFLNLLKTLYEKDKNRSNKNDKIYQQYLDGELKKLKTLVNSLITLRSASV